MSADVSWQKPKSWKSADFPGGKPFPSAFIRILAKFQDSAGFEPTTSLPAQIMLSLQPLVPPKRTHTKFWRSFFIPFFFFFISPRKRDFFRFLALLKNFQGKLALKTSPSSSLYQNTSLREEKSSISQLGAIRGHAKRFYIVNQLY